jgi:hypothetical protein
VCPDDAAVALAGGRAGRLTVSLRGWDEAATLEGPLAAESDRVVPLLNAVVATGVRRLIVEVSAIGGASPWLPELLMSVGRQLEDRGGWLITFGEAVRLDLVDPPLDEVFRAYRGVADPRPG